MKKIKKIVSAQSGVSLNKREGVFVHGYKCLNCNLHFNLYSWQYKRDSVLCPECGSKGGVLHTVSILSTDKNFGFMGNGTEIYNHCPLGAPYMGDLNAQLTLQKQFEMAMMNKPNGTASESDEA